MSDLRVSVALATYNGERFLEEQLDSLARQRALPHELTVTDDLSTDRTLDILETFARRAPFPVRIVRNPRRLGYGDNFLKAVSLCTGDLIAFCDQDDVWLETKLARCAEALRDRSVVLAIHGGSVIDENNCSLARKFPDIRRDIVLHRLSQDPWRGFPGFAMVFRADLPLALAAVRPWGEADQNVRMLHDQWVRFLANIFGNTAYIADSLSLHRRHGANVTDSSPVPVMVRARNVIKTGTAAYSKQASLLQHWADYLTESAAHLDAPYQSMARAGASYYRVLGSKLVERSCIYSREKSLIGRYGALVKLARLGGYRRRTRGGLGLRSFLKDLSVGLLCGRIW